MSKKILAKRAFQSPLICRICGDIARGMNFDVMTCMSCKAFFRRNAIREFRVIRCQLNDDCPITQKTRAGCSACRLKKCFALGMNPKLIRSLSQMPPISTYHQRMKTNKQEQTWLSQPRTLSLLHNDRSTLTLDEWNLLSNVVHAYDEQNLIIRTQFLLKERSTLPLKLRSKNSNTLDLIGSFYTAVQPLIERSPYFHNLSPDIRRILVQNNLNGTGAFNSMFAAAEARVFDNEFYVESCNEIYGANYVKESQRLLARIESNGTLIKMIMIILVFSSNCSIVIPEQQTYTSPTSSIILTRIQNIFITMMWKYLVYQYGFIEAVRRLDYLVKNYLDVLNRVNENTSIQHGKMIDVIVEKTTHKLTLDD